MTKRAIIFIGIPASGKSTFYERKFSDEYSRINLDTLKTRNKEKIWLEEFMGAGKNIVIDNCNPEKLDRQRYIPALKALDYEIHCYYFKSWVERCSERNQQREGKAQVPKVAIISHKQKLENPSFDEGFDRIFFVEIVPPLGEDKEELFRIKELHKVFEDAYIRGEIEFWEDFFS